MPTAVFSVAPMPQPVSRYQLPLNCLGWMPAAFHSLSSALWVPESSPREATCAEAYLILASEAVTSLLPAAPVGPAAGPPMPWPLYLTSARRPRDTPAPPPPYDRKPG